MFVNLLIIFVLISISAAVEWNYNDNSDFGPLAWRNHYPSCGGNEQSPIDITADHVEKLLTEPLIFVNYENKVTTKFSIYNSGYGVSIKVKDRAFQIREGHLPATYSLDQIHFHWSQSDVMESEHIVNQKVHPLEIHLVHFDSTRFTDMNSAMGDPTGLAVLGVCVEIAAGNETSSTTLAYITEHLQNIIYDGNETLTDSFTLNGLLPRRKEYYRYKGSLTIPTCNESVFWTIFTDPIYISAANMEKFRQVRSSTGEILEKNFRPIQPLNNRIMYHYTEESASFKPTASLPLLIAMLLAAGIHCQQCIYTN